VITGTPFHVGFCLPMLVYSVQYCYSRQCFILSSGGCTQLGCGWFRYRNKVLRKVIARDSSKNSGILFYNR